MKLKIACILLIAPTAATAGSHKRVLHVPKMASPPAIDGKIETEEWADASAVTGFSSYYHKDMYPEAMRTLWYIGYDDVNLYLAMHYAVPQGVSLKADTKNPDDNDNEASVLFGDHVEIQVTPHSATRALQQGYGFYKLVVNPVGIFSDTWYYNGVPGSEPAWNSGCEIKSTFDSRNWWLEIAWPLSSMRNPTSGGMIEKADGLRLITQLVRSGFCVGYSYAGWTPDPWLSFDHFYTIILGPDAPVMQFVRKGDVVYGGLDTEIRMKGKRGQNATVSLEIVNPDKTKVFSEKKDLALKPNASAVAAFKAENMAVADSNQKGRCSYNLNVTTGGKQVFTMSSPFIKHTDDFDRRTYRGYLSSRPKTDYKSRFAYYPVNGKAHVYLDLDVIGELPEAVRNAQSLRLRVTTRDGKQKICEETVPIKNMMARELFNVGALKGAYTATLELLSKEKKAVSKRSYDFVRKNYPWENNTIGAERVVVPPFRPLKIDDRTIRSRCAEFRIGKGGLWDGVTVFGKELLRAPIRIEGVFNGKKTRWQGDKVSIKGGSGKTFPPEFDKYRFFEKDCPRIPLEELADATGYEALVTASGSIGGIKTMLNGVMDYDGFYKLTLNIAPKGGAVRVDRLDVVLDLWNEARDLGLMRNGIGIYYQLPDKNGVVWESKSLVAKPIGFKGTFIPAVAVGDGTYCLQFRAASDEGWLLDDDASCMLIEGTNEGPVLRLRIVNKAAVIEKERSLTFALIPLPATPAVENWRHKVWRPHYAHIAYGWRMYGTGGDNWYLPNDDEYRLLGDCIHYPEKHPELDIHSAVKGNARNAKIGPVLMYSSTVAVGSPLPAVETYGGQWYGNSAIKFGTSDARVGKRKNLNGRFIWDKGEHFSEARPTSYDDDLVDNYMWYHKKLITLTNANGHHWDNEEMAWYKALGTGAYGYVRDDGHIQPTANIFMRRTLMKRLYTMGWLVGKPPLYFSKAFHQAPFATISRAIEGEFYIFTEGGTFFDQFTQDLVEFRTFGCSSHIPFRYDCHYEYSRNAPDNHHPMRSILAVGILHDHAVMGRFDAAFWEKTVDTIDREIGFLDKERQAEFLPYWSNAGMIRFVQWDKNGKHRFVNPQHCFVSCYRSLTRKGTALVWLVNSTDAAVSQGLWIDVQKLVGRKDTLLRLRDMEAGQPIEARPQSCWGDIRIPPKDFRALILEEVAGGMRRDVVSP